MTLGQYLRQHRQAAGITLREAATKIGVSHVFLGHVERGNKALPERLIPKLLQLLPSLDEDTLRERAEEYHRTIPTFVRKIVSVGLADEERTMLRKLLKKP